MTSIFVFSHPFIRNWASEALYSEHPELFRGWIYNGGKKFMFISISENGSLNLEDVDAMKSFSIVETANTGTQGQAINALKSIAEPTEDNHYWIDIDSVIAISPRKNDQEWVDAFWQMLKAVEPYGYVNMEKRLVKAHVEIK